VHCELTGDLEFLSDANRRAIRRNLDRMYPVDDGSAFADLLVRIDAAARKPKPRRS
jgi:hypothetical protein